MTRDQIIAIQSRLQRRGFSPGAIDGVWAARSCAAFIGYVAQNTGGLADWGVAADRYWPEYKIDTPLRIAHAVSRWCVETGGFKRFEESLSYSASRMMQVWPKRFPMLSSAQPYANNPQALANNVYGGRGGNNTANDGWLYRGRGPTMITFHSNYESVSHQIGVDILGSPDMVLDPDVGMQVAGNFWLSRKVYAEADQNDAAGVCTLIQGGNEGLDVQCNYLKRALAIMVG